MMRRNAGFSAVAVGTLALGIASASAIFSVVSASLLTPPPYSEPERFMVLWETDRRTGGAREGLSGPDYIELIERKQVFEDTAAFRTTPRTLTSRGQPPEPSDQRQGRVDGADAGRRLLDPDPPHRGTTRRKNLRHSDRRRAIVKRAGRNEEAGWMLVSDNPDKDRFATRPWPDDAKVIGEVKWDGQWFE